MGTGQKKTARNVAIGVLNQLDLRRGYARDILGKSLGQTQERQKATDLVFGTIRNLQAIDGVINTFAGCPVERISKRLLSIIRTGVYELVYCPETAQYSVVNEAAESAKAVGGRKQTGFVNAVLREITRHIINRQSVLSGKDPRAILPQGISVGCEFDSGFLPGPVESAEEYLSAVFSLPRWLVSGWLERFGFEKSMGICFASNRKPGICVRANSLKITPQGLVGKFESFGIDCEIIGDSMLKVKSPAAVTKLPGFAEGLFSIQDLTAASVVNAIKPKQGWKILDLCAAPGTKTCQLAEFCGDKATIVATDIDVQRLKMVSENVKRLSLSSVSVIEYEKLADIAADIGPFDCVLVDAPCSNTGVLARRVEVRHRITPEAVKELGKVQGELLNRAKDMIKPDGVICYSTCSIESDENDKCVSGFLKRNKGFAVEFEKLTLPSVEGFGCDGGYLAVLTKKQR